MLSQVLTVTATTHLTHDTSVSSFFTLAHFNFQSPLAFIWKQLNITEKYKKEINNLCTNHTAKVAQAGKIWHFRKRGWTEGRIPRETNKVPYKMGLQFSFNWKNRNQKNPPKLQTEVLCRGRMLGAHFTHPNTLALCASSVERGESSNHFRSMTLTTSFTNLKHVSLTANKFWENTQGSPIT